MRYYKIILILSIPAVLISCKSDVQANAADRLNNEARLLAEQGREREAINLYHEALSFSDIPDKSRAAYLYNLGLAYDVIDMKDSAKYFFTESANIYPKDSYEYLIGHAYISLLDKNVDSGRMLLEKAWQMDSTLGDANAILGIIYMGEYDTSFFDPQKALPYNMSAYRNYQDGSTKFMLAKNYYYLNQTDKTLRLLRQLHREYPNLTAYLSALIMVEQETYHSADAEKLLLELKKINSTVYYQMLQNPVKPGSHEIVWRIR
jgi:tetratricopeptide (TPR) repeat protein